MSALLAIHFQEENGYLNMKMSPEAVRVMERVIRTGMHYGWNTDCMGHPFYSDKTDLEMANTGLKVVLHGLNYFNERRTA